MALHVTLATAPGKETGGTPVQPATREIVIKITATLSGNGVAERLAERYGPADFSIGGYPLGGLTPGRPPFISGAVILASPVRAGMPCHGAAVPRTAARDTPLLLVVCSGPDAGLIKALHRGTYQIGRGGPSGAGTDPRIGIADPALSRNHAVLVVGTDMVEIRDLGSANGTRVGGRPVQAAVVDTGSVLQFGYSTCRLVVPASAAATASGSGDPSEPLAVQLQERGQNSGLFLAGALLPLVLGVVLALATGMWMFLAFSALSAVTALLGAAGARRRRREQSAAVALAAHKDSCRRRAAAPEMGSVALAAVLGSMAPPRFPEAKPGVLKPGLPREPGAVHFVRIGTAPQPANLVPVPPSPRFSPPMLPDMPVLLRLGKDRDISVDGPDAGALFRTVLLRAAASPAAGSMLHVVYAGSLDELEQEARFLPGVTFAALPRASAAAAPTAAAVIGASLEPAADTAALVFCLSGGWAEHAADLLAAMPDSMRRRATVIRLGGGPAPVTVSLSGARGVLSTGSDTLDFVPDLVQRTTFEQISRALAAARAHDTGAAAPGPAGPLPSSAAFTGQHALSPDLLLRDWEKDGHGARTVIGISPAGPVSVDLVRDGPHFLVAGTTGSGKSEFLRTFIASLAAHQPPSSVSVLLIDFKGGAGLGPLARLPHAVGLLTDLSAGEVSRALASLRAEVRRRENLLARAGADSLTAYNSGRGRAGALPRLLVVVDEFRMLADEVPSALPELMRIAAIGRSLGLHLLLATQRPQGAVTTDIRANISTSIALRVASAAESRDVLGSDCAAGIPADMPGRAYISAGGGTPLEFQSLSTAVSRSGDNGPLMELEEYLLTRYPEQPPGPGQSDTLGAICSAVTAAARQGGYPAPSAPIAQPLPRALTPDTANRYRRDLAPEVAVSCAPPSGADGPSGAVLLGLLDDPEQQRQQILTWDPGRDSHLAVLGSPRSGSVDCLSLAASGLLAAGPGRHLYVLDADGSLSLLAGAEQTGAYVGPQEAKRAARVLAYVAAEVVRRIGPPGPGTAGSGNQDPPQLTLAVSGWTRWCGTFRSGREPAAEADLADIVRDGERAGVCVIIAGDRELLSSFPLIPNRLFFPTEATAETLLLWPRLPPMERIRGRAMVQGRIAAADGLVGQIIQPEPVHGLSRSRPAGPATGAGLPPGCPPPHRIEALPAYVAPEHLAAPPGPDYLPVGVSGDELETAHVRVPSGSVFLVTGPRGSGRTSFLRQLERSAHSSLHCFSGNGGELCEKDLDQLSAAHPQDQARHLLLLVDDADLAPPLLHRKLAELHSRGARLALAAVCGPQLTARLPLAVQVRTAPLGALLRPGTPADGDIFGIRADTGRRPPGRCFLIEGAASVEAQAAYMPG